MSETVIRPPQQSPSLPTATDWRPFFCARCPVVCLAAFNSGESGRSCRASAASFTPQLESCSRSRRCRIQLLGSVTIWSCASPCSATFLPARFYCAELASLPPVCCRCPSRPM